MLIHSEILLPKENTVDVSTCSRGLLYYENTMMDESIHSKFFAEVKTLVCVSGTKN